MTGRVQPFDIGCEPSPSVPSEIVLADGWKTYLLFFAVSKDVDGSGRLKDLGVAVVNCEGCVVSKFGYPNDEGLDEHPLYDHGMSECTTDVLEVVDSAWAREIADQKRESARRIWGGRGMDWQSARDCSHRHFIVTLKEKTFECLASSIAVEKFCDTFEEAFAYVFAEFSKH